MALYRCCIKNLLDRILALTGLILSAPVFFLVWLALMIANRGEPFFFQPRPGRNGKIFRIVKFRTMNNRRDAKGELLPDAERLTPVGRFVRKTSLDEIPQLINVLKGEMSLIGPRPLLVEYLPLYSKEQARRHEVRPGITGWAQVNGRNAIDWETKFRLDVWYVDHLSFLLDLKILWLTVLKVFRSEGISAANSATMEKFTGSASGN
jgi:lipopolysaccharide/colanic/teichoic acid biosynthesis glycosyltransferase